MNNAELLDRYVELYDTTASSGDPKKMKIFGEAEKWAFEQFVSINPRAAEMWLQKLEPVDWNNYLTEEEADRIMDGLMNQDGSVGPMWSREQIARAVQGLDGALEARPYYNRCALVVTMNMLASDHMASARKFISEERLPEFFYQQAQEQLKDIDRPNFIRSYYGL